jgi:hypothetical protein
MRIELEPRSLTLWKDVNHCIHFILLGGHCTSLEYIEVIDVIQDIFDLSQCLISDLFLTH